MTPSSDHGGDHARAFTGRGGSRGTRLFGDGLFVTATLVAATLLKRHYGMKSFPQTTPTRRWSVDQDNRMPGNVGPALCCALGCPVRHASCPTPHASWPTPGGADFLRARALGFHEPHASTG